MYRWFKSLNVAVASERQQRKLAKEIVDQTIVAERGAFTFSLERGRTEIREVPFVYRPNLIAAIADLVDRHHRYKTRILFFILVHHRSYHRSRAGLTWHNGAIPSNEIWVKLGGDKGHGSFKLNIQLVNTANPNSMKNTSLLSVFEAGDTTTNLHTALNLYKEHVVEAQGMEIKYEIEYFASHIINFEISYL